VNNLASRIERLEAKRPPAERVVISTLVHENNLDEIAVADRMAAEAKDRAKAEGKDFLEIRRVIVDRSKARQ
jgi:hypothetical protein